MTEESKLQKFRSLLKGYIQKALNESGLDATVKINEKACEAPSDNLPNCYGDYPRDDPIYTERDETVERSDPFLPGYNRDPGEYKFNIGDIVTLNTGGIAMNITNINHSHPIVMCSWMNENGDLFQEEFPESCLTLFVEGKN